MRFSKAYRPEIFKFRPVKKAFFLLGPFILFSFNGCVPWVYKAREGQVLSVFNEADGRPIEGVRVNLQTWQLGAGLLKEKVVSEVNVVSDQDGAALVPPKKKWGVFAPVPHGSPSFVDWICLEKNGYETRVIDPFKGKNHVSPDFEKKNRFDLSQSKNEQTEPCPKEKENEK